MPKATAAKSQTNTLGQDFETLREDAETLVSDAYAAARDVTDQAVDEVTAQGEDLLESLKDYAANRPLTTLAIAAAAGFILAKIMR
jgi:ElaB/YqjD/DUF883 family membrane-anchored ribosome-binding protein